MPTFANPFQGNVDKKITRGELIQAIRIDLASELEAIFLYEAHAAATTDPVAEKVLSDIANEEKEHVGELMTLMRYLDPDIVNQLSEGEGEVKTMMKELGIVEPALENTTVGSLMDE